MLQCNVQSGAILTFYRISITLHKYSQHRGSTLNISLQILASKPSGVFPLYLSEDSQSRSFESAHRTAPTPDLIRKVRKDLTRRRSDTNVRDKEEGKHSSVSREGSKSPAPSGGRTFSLGSLRTRSASLDTNCSSGTDAKNPSGSSDCKKKDPKTFSMTIFVNETEKNKIVDLLHKAKSIISKKVEKVMGIKPQKSCISNADALQTVLETWMDREQEEEKEDNIIVEKLIKEQEKQVESLIQSGNFQTVPTLALEEGDEDEEDDDTIEEELNNDLEVSRLTIPRYLKPPERKRDLSLSDTTLASVRSLSPMENVPCPFGVRPESSLYPPRLRRPSSLYGAGAAAASSRPPSRQVSVSPSVFDLESQAALSDKYQANLEYQHQLQQEEEVEEEEEDDDDEIPSRYARPDSFTIPIGGVWRPGDEGEVRWGTITSETEYQEGLRTEAEGDLSDPVLPPACSVSGADHPTSLRVKLTIST